jgi:hypothetical protein
MFDIHVDSRLFTIAWTPDGGAKETAILVIINRHEKKIRTYVEYCAGQGVAGGWIDNTKYSATAVSLGRNTFQCTAVVFWYTIYRYKLCLDIQAFQYGHRCDIKLYVNEFEDQLQNAR